MAEPTKPEPVTVVLAITLESAERARWLENLLIEVPGVMIVTVREEDSLLKLVREKEPALDPELGICPACGNHGTPGDPLVPVAWEVELADRGTFARAAIGPAPLRVHRSHTLDRRSGYYGMEA